MNSVKGCFSLRHGACALAESKLIYQRFVFIRLGACFHLHLGEHFFLLFPFLRFHPLSPTQRALVSESRCLHPDAGAMPLQFLAKLPLAEAIQSPSCVVRRGLFRPLED